MDVKVIDAELPTIQKRYDEALIEAHRLEGEFRFAMRLKEKLNRPETKETVNAEAESSSNIRTESN